MRTLACACLLAMGCGGAVESSSIDRSTVPNESPTAADDGGPLLADASDAADTDTNQDAPMPADNAGGGGLQCVTAIGTFGCGDYPINYFPFPPDSGPLLDGAPNLGPYHFCETWQAPDVPCVSGTVCEVDTLNGVWGTCR